jgi:hypothetical protein
VSVHRDLYTDCEIRKCWDHLMTKSKCKGSHVYLAPSSFRNSQKGFSHLFIRKSKEQKGDAPSS